VKAIIYAAGRGLRLRPRQENVPKVLLEIGGRTLLDWHALRLMQAGIREVVVLTGFEREQVTTRLSIIRRRHSLKVSEIVNPDYTEGSVLSFLVSVPFLESCSEPVLIMDGDVLYPAEFLTRLIDSAKPTAMLIDRNYSTDNEDPMLVPVRDGRPIDFCKKWSGEADFVGESIGFFKIALEDLPPLIEETRKRGTAESRGESYDDVIRALVRAGRFGIEDVTGLPWTEIDFPEDLDHAREEIFPAIQKSEAQK
jgi:choline kinase